MLLKNVHDACHQGYLWPHDRQIYGVASGKIGQFRDLRHPQRHTFCYWSHTRIAWRGIDIGDATTLCQFPGQGVLPCSGANDEYAHESILLVNATLPYSPPQGTREGQGMA